MMSEEEIKKLLDDIESNEILYYPVATTFENAPRALIQSGLELQSRLLRRILGLPNLDLPKLRKK